VKFGFSGQDGSSIKSSLTRKHVSIVSEPLSFSNSCLDGQKIHKVSVYMLSLETQLVKKKMLIIHYSKSAFEGDLEARLCRRVDKQRDILPWMIFNFILSILTQLFDFIKCFFTKNVYASPSVW
jgi:hypothetical protein